MEIKLLGQETVWLKGKSESVLINPMGGDKKVNARVWLFSQEEGHQDLKREEKVVIFGPGEYEVGEVEIVGINSGQGSTIYVITIDNIKVLHLPRLNQTLKDKKIERIDSGDVLLAAAMKENKGGGKVLKDLAQKWGVNYLIPYGFEDNNGSQENVLDQLDEEGLKPMESLKVTAEDLPEGMEVVILNPLNHEH